MFSQINPQKVAYTEQIEAFKKNAKFKTNTENKAKNENTTNANDKQKILIISNRLPMTLNKNKETGEYSYKMSSGGLVSAMSTIKGWKMIWIGWPGGELPKEDEEKVTKELHDQHKCYPVFLDAQTVELYYNGYSNNVLWPLFHYISPPTDFEQYQEKDTEWEAYKKANWRFAEVVVDLYSEGDLIWVHDYHLMLVPKMIRKIVKKRGIPDPVIGWFLHTPFPSSEIFRMHNQRKEILEGILSANLAGFHVYDYKRHFLNSCTRILGLNCSGEGVDNISKQGFFVHVDSFPIGIDPTGYTEFLEHEEVIKHYNSFKETFKGKRVILGVDRLDYIKGIPHKLLGFEEFLIKHPEWRGKVVMIQLAVPSRTDVPEYQRLKALSHQIVGRINSHFGELGYQPIHYLDQSVDRWKLIALYRISEIALITSLRDGMNLVSYEYVAAQVNNYGILILSEFAGAAKSLGGGSITINPWNIFEMSGAINTALNMNHEERKEKHAYCLKYVQTYTSQFWGEKFVRCLKKAAVTMNDDTVIKPPLLKNNSSFMDKIMNSYKKNKKMLLVINEEGVFTDNFHLNSVPVKLKSESNNTKYIEIIKQFLKDSNHKVLLLCSQKINECETAKEVDGLRINLVVESGYQYRLEDSDTWFHLKPHLDLSWMNSVQDVMHYFQERTPGSFIIKNNASIMWDYRRAHAEFGMTQSKELQMHLKAGPLSGVPAESLITGPSRVEVRHFGVSKSVLLEKLFIGEFKEFLEDCFILCIGDFNWKEDDEISTVFKRFRNGELETKITEENSVLCTVGEKASYCDICISSQAEVINLLNNFI